MTSLNQTASAYLRQLCIDIPSRAVGSAGNRRATEWFAQTIARFGFQTEMPPFTCMDWVTSGALLTVNKQIYAAHASPYSLGCDVRAPLVAVGTVSELDTAQLNGRIVLLHGEIAREQLMPKNFTFYNPEEHQHIYRALESQHPTAIITATGRNPMMAGGIYPFPMFEDGDFDLPSVYITDEDGAQIAHEAGKMVHVVSRAERRPSTGCNVIARKAGQTDGRVVVMAHIDAKAGTPGALDDGSGIVTLLLLAEALADYHGRLGIEIVAVNGEDYYANPGEMDYLRRNEKLFHNIALAINLDGLGYIKGKTAYSLYEMPPDLAKGVRAVMSAYPGMCEGESWYQGDHTLMVINQRPAIALTSECAFDLLTHLIHTEHDTPDQVDPVRLVEAVYAIYELIKQVERSMCVD